MNPALGVIITRPAIAPRKAESTAHFPVSSQVERAYVRAPELAQTLVTTKAMTDLKFSESVVPASNASHDPQMMINAMI